MKLKWTFVEDTERSDANFDDFWHAEVKLANGDSIADIEVSEQPSAPGIWDYRVSFSEDAKSHRLEGRGFASREGAERGAVGRLAETLEGCAGDLRGMQW